MAEAPETAVPVTTAAEPAKKSSVRDWSTSKVINVLRFANLCNGLLLILGAILVFITGLVSINFTTTVLAAYVCFLGLLMTCLECNIGSSALRKRLIRYFGFMFSFAGRTIFILFCATVICALSNVLAYIICAVTAINGCFNGYVMCVHPSFRNGELSATADPSGGYSGGESEMVAFLKSNPALAKKASVVAVKFAQDNPDIARTAIQGALAGATAPKAGGAGDSDSNPWK